MDNFAESIFFVTAGRGTEEFAVKELKNRLSAHVVHPTEEGLVRDGKIFFTFDSNVPFDLKEMLKLKSVERIFVAIKDYSNTNYVKGKRLFLDKLMDEVSSEHNYSFAQRVLQQLKSLSCVSEEVNMKNKCVELESTSFLKAKKARLSTNAGEENEVDDQGTKCISEDALQRIVCTDTKCLSSDSLQTVTCDGSNCPSRDSFHRTAYNQDNLKHKHSSATMLNHVMDRSEDVAGNISFRLSIKCSGRIRKWLNFKKLSKDLSWRVVRSTGWVVDLRNPMYEVCVHISDQYVTIGVPLTSLPLSRRKYVCDPGLRGPIAWIMTEEANIQKGDIVLDPMCGKGTLLLESCSEMKEVTYIGIDNNMDQLTAAIENTKLAGLEKHIHFLLADALGLPLTSDSLNVVLCDAPFNQKHFMSLEANEFYFAFLSEMARVLQINGRLVLLTSQELSDVVVNILHNSDAGAKGESLDSLWQSSSLKSQTKEDSSASDNSVEISLKLLSQHNVKLGETLATILIMKKHS